MDFQHWQINMSIGSHTFTEICDVQSLAEEIQKKVNELVIT